MGTVKQGYVNGSDLLLYVDGKPVGHCSTHSATFSTETKDRAVKPVASALMSAGLWKNKGVTGLSISVSAEGLGFYGETESGFKTLFAKWKEAKPVTLKCLERENSTTPYLEGLFILTSLERTAPAQDDVTYSVSFENDGMPTTMDESAITENGTTV